MRFMTTNLVKVLTITALAAGCAETSGFRFPVEQGDAADGKQAFIDHQCHQCHTVAGVELPTLAGETSVQLQLAGGRSAAKSYSELVTSVINPDHVISERYREQLRLNGTVPLESPMVVPSIDNMTVRQLIDIVAFLHARYALIDGYDTGT